MAGRPRLTDESFDKKPMGVNPFIKNLKITVSQITTENEIVGIRRDEEVAVAVNGNGVYLNKFYAEVQNYTKLYQSATHRKVISKLPARAKELLWWIAFELKPSKDFIVININRYKKENGCSHSTYTRAVADLVQENVVMPTQWQSVFWINPALFFNGNRVHKYHDSLEIFEKRSEKKQPPVKEQRKSVPYNVESILK